MLEEVTMTVSTGRDSDKFMLRFPEGMRERIAEVAKANGRSMNSEIVSRLEQSFQFESSGSLLAVQPSAEALDARLKQLSEAVAEVAELMKRGASK